MSQKLSSLNSTIFQQMDGPLRFRMTNAYLFVTVLQKNQEALCHLIAALLHITRKEIQSIEIQNPIVLGQAIDEKDCILDLPVGADYNQMLPIMQIGILDFNYPEENEEFYQQIYLMNQKTHKIYNDKASIHVLCLPQIENATSEDRSSGLYLWAKVFQATTWKELIDLSKNNPVMEDTVVTIASLSADERIRQQCARREKFERDRISAINYGYQQGHNEGHSAGFSEGIEIFPKLNEKLKESGRDQELSKALNDPAYRYKLLEEFGLI